MSAAVGGAAVLSDAVKDAIRTEVGKYPQPRSALLIALHLVQDEIGYVPLEAQRQVAGLLGIRPIEVREVVSFYPMYHEHPVGRRNIQVCVNIACALAGARQVVRALEERLGVAAGEGTSDGAYSLEEVQCLGSCGTAVCVQVNNEPYIEGVRSDGIDDLLRKVC
ncbi:MAG: NAD(P)H-dependent oxidoreductase subunit E [Deltaproteobacteria bacterium]|nr:NAD(P)H-dependent oxidoreductase subunit E [Deltaproteobacteria bacterium]